jgi:hypothetical protein
MDSVIDSFLVKLTFDQDERSRQKFNEGLTRVQERAAEFGAKIGELPTFGAGEGTESGGHGAERRGRFGHGGGGGPLTPGTIGAAGSLTALITAEAQRAGIDPRIMEGIRAGESAHGAKYDVKEIVWNPPGGRSN